MCSTRDCSTKGACPFAHTEESEMVQNYGCLPSPLEILSMRIHHGKTWACHSNPEQPCRGAIMRLKELGYDHRVIDPKLVTEDTDWSPFITLAPAFSKEVSRRDLDRIMKHAAS